VQARSQEWCRANKAECLAVQPPGRNMRLREPCITTCQDLAEALLPVVASKLSEAPYIVSHCLEEDHPAPVNLMPAVL
jgi:surfactin synthase thioesterase subunit